MISLYRNELEKPKVSGGTPDPNILRSEACCAIGTPLLVSYIMAPEASLA